MNKLLPLAVCAVCLLAGFTAQSQNLRLSRTIQVTDTITDDNGLRFPVSSDDAEQENNAIDALYDDDLDAGWEGEPGDQNILTTGLRFRQVFIPKGAVIDSAFIVVYSHESKTASDVARITITGEATDNAQTFTDDVLITDRPRTGASLLWVVDQPWGLWTAERTPDLRAIVQEIVNRPNWEPGNALALILQGENQGPSEDENAREFESFENIADPEDGGDGQNHPERVPELVIYYSVKSGRIEIPIAVTDTITDDNGLRFPVSSDDAEQENNEIDALFDDDLDAGWEGEPGDQNILTAGVRFRNIPLPKGAVIDSAFIQVVSHESKTSADVARITIVGEAADSAATYTETALITDRPRTTASLLWVVDQPWGLWTTERTPDLRAIVQEVINRPGWKAENAIAFTLLGENQGPSEDENAREFESYENIADPEDGGDGQNHPERVPRLIVYYTSPNLSVSTFSPLNPDVKELTVYPNPTHSIATLELESENAADVFVYDNQGRMVVHLRHAYGRTIQLNTAGMQVGSYFIQVLQDGVRYSQQLIVK